MRILRCDLDKFPHILMRVVSNGKAFVERTGIEINVDVFVPPKSLPLSMLQREIQMVYFLCVEISGSYFYNGQFLGLVHPRHVIGLIIGKVVCPVLIEFIISSGVAIICVSYGSRFLQLNVSQVLSMFAKRNYENTVF